MTVDMAQLLEKKTPAQNAPLTIGRFFPTQLKRRGVELRIVMEGEAGHASKVDLALVKAIARGRRWFEELASNRAADTLEIAKREGLPDSYVRRLIPLAFLAPSLVEAICAGRQSPDLTAERLTRGRLPLQWTAQEEALG